MATATPEVENGDIDSRADVDDKPRSAKFWLGEIAAAKKRDKSWQSRASKVVSRYRDERDMERDSAKGERRANILWSNTEILKAALFQGLSNPDVRRAFPKKGKDNRVARTTALVLERALSACAHSYDGDAQIEAAIEDMLLPGRGTAWIVYEADVSKPDPSEGIGEDATGGTPLDALLGIQGSGDRGQGPNASSLKPDTWNLAPGQEEITNQTVRLDHVYWEDYLSSAGRKDSDVWWKARGHNYSRDELRKYWAAHADKIPLDVNIAGFDSRKARGPDDDDTFKRARVWEIWDKSKKQRVFVAEGYETELERAPDPYGLKDFYPTVEPLYAVKTTSSLTPIPEYTLYQDQADELDSITTRLSRLINNLKRRGVYDASAEGPDNQLSQLAFAGDDQFLPYRNFAALMEKGGLKNVFQTEDLVPTVQVVEKLYQQRALLVQTIYEVTGISDVIRGATNPNETATAQRIKGQFGSLRLQKRQKRVQSFIRDLYRLKAEIIAEHFTREMLQEMSGIDLPTQAEQTQAKQQIASIQQQMQAAQQSQQAMAAYQQQIAGSGSGGQGPRQTPLNPGPYNPNPSPAGALSMTMAPTPPQVVPMPQVDPEQMQALQAIVTAVAWEDVAAILRSDQRRAYKVDIETENTAQVDNDAEKQQRIEFLSTMQGFLERVIPAVMQMPALAPMTKELVMFAVGAFKVGRTLEESFSDAFDQLQEQAQQQAKSGAPKDPVADAKAKQIEVATQAAIARAKADQQLSQADLMAKAADAQATQLKTQADLQNAAIEREAKAQERAANWGIAQQESQRKTAEAAHGADVNARRAAADIAVAQQKHAFDMQKSVAEHNADITLRREQAWFDMQRDMAKHQADMHQGRLKAEMDQAMARFKMFNDAQRAQTQPHYNGGPH